MSTLRSEFSREKCSDHQLSLSSVVERTFTSRIVQVVTSIPGERIGRHAKMSAVVLQFTSSSVLQVRIWTCFRSDL
jgi:hypothetical protein